LKRDDGSAEFSSRDVSAAAVKNAIPNNAVDYSIAKKTPRKRLKDRDPAELAIGDRLNVSMREVPEGPDNGQSFAQLLMQGLQSKDVKILEEVLRVDSDAAIRSTLKRLPVEYVGPLLSVLSKWLTEKVNGAL
jgi:hypothetical protein